MIKKYVILILLFFYSVNMFGEGLSIENYLKFTSIYYKTPEKFEDFTEKDYFSQNSNILRTRILYEKSIFTIETAYELSPQISTDSNINSLLSSSNNNILNYRIIDFDNYIYKGKNEENIYLAHNLDRLNLTFSFKYADITIGRQSVSFGYAKVLSSLDIFSPFAFQDLNKEEKRGIDAIKFIIPLGEMSQIETGSVFGEDFEYSNDSFYIKYKGYILNTDYSIMFNHFKENAFIGTDLTRSFYGSTIFFEVAYFMPEYTDDFIKTNNYIRATAGFDYQFSNELFLSSEYQYCSAGETKAYNLLNMIAHNTSTAYTEGGVYLYNRHYLSILFSYPVTSLFNLSVNSLINITEIATYNSIKAEYNIKENLYLDLGLFIPYSKNTSEFSYYPKMLFITIKLYN